MKNTHNLGKILISTACLTCLAVGLSTVAVGAKEAAKAQPAGWFSSKKDITGAVTAKSAASLTVDDKVVMVSASTPITKEGQTIKLADIQVGDHVRVTATKGKNDMLVASSIEVVPSSTGSTG